MLWPDDEAAVVGGNVLTSQRVCDVILKAFGACADSQVSGWCAIKASQTWDRPAVGLADDERVFLFFFSFVRVGSPSLSHPIPAALLQGCMNNLTFGNASLGYYETICGGAGAGPTWHGRSGVHTHMTNTRITDPEVRATTVAHGRHQRMDSCL